VPHETLETLRKLEARGFNDSHFRRLHPFGHALSTYRNYITDNDLQRFARGSSSHALKACLKDILAHSSKEMAAEEWVCLLETALERNPIISRPRRSSERSTRSRVAKVPLAPPTSAHKRFIAEQISDWIPTARDTSHPMRDVARWLINNTLWRWTVDAFDAAANAIVVDGARKPNDFMPMSDAARLASIKDLRHEHVVPRNVITSYITAETLSVDELIAALDGYCLAAVITKAEDDQLSAAGLRDRMPKGWKWGDDPWARYKAAKIVVHTKP
jgi:hypothetical protein